MAQRAARRAVLFASLATLALVLIGGRAHVFVGPRDSRDSRSLAAPSPQPGWSRLDASDRSPRLPRAPRRGSGAITSTSPSAWQYVQLNLQRIFGISVFIAVYFFQRLFGSHTPVGGMLIVFFSMLSLEQLNQSWAERVFKWLEPGYRFLVKWLIVFFVPALVRVSLIHAELGLWGILRVLLLLLVGWFITFTSTAVVASAFPDVDLESPEPRKQAPATPAQKSAPARFPYLRFVVGMVIAAVAASFGFHPGLDQTIFMMCAALAGFTLAKRLPSNVQKFVHPLFICAAGTFLAAALWILLEHPGLHTMDVIRIYSDWPGGGALLYFLLPIAVVSLGLLLFENRLLIKKDLGPILATAACSTTVTIGSAPLLSHLFGLPRSFALCTTARCALSPIAMGMASILGSPPPIAVAMTTFSGVLGVMLGPTMFKAMNLKKARARGLALGCSSHGVGVVPIAASDRQAFAYGCVGLILIATMNMLVMQTPFIRRLILASM